MPGQNNEEILDFFEQYVLPGRATDKSHSSANSQHNPGSGHNTPLEPGGKLYSLVQRVHSMHCRARQAPGARAHNISEAVQIWQELDGWDPEEQMPAPDKYSLYKCYQGAVFLWIYFIIYPEDIGGWKTKNALQNILINMEGARTERLVSFLIIPLFFAGLTATEAADQEVIREQYRRVSKHSAYRRSNDWWHIVEARWRVYVSSGHSTWDWINNLI